jgi:hypothetical protein
MKGRTNKITTRGSLKFYFQKGRYPKSFFCWPKAHQMSGTALAKYGDLSLSIGRNKIASTWWGWGLLRVLREIGWKTFLFIMLVMGARQFFGIINGVFMVL